MGVAENVRAARAKHAARAAERYARAGAQRRAVQEQRNAGVPFPDAPEALAARAARLLDRQGVPAAAVVEGIRGEPLSAPASYERIIGLSRELQAWSFLPRGARAARTVARISVREDGRELPLGTGFLVSPRLLMTNHHVLPDPETARQCFVEFDAQVTIDNAPGAPVRLELDPTAFFLADERLDFALVLVPDPDGGRPPGETFGWNRLSAQQGKVVIGEPVNVIGHPMGRLKEIAVRDNELEVRLADFLQYRTDTEPGNSGSPVFNDQWEVVALHHSGVPRTDEQGRTLRKDGRIWQPGDGEDAVAWVSNEGVRVSSVLGHLAASSPDAAHRALLAELGADSGLREAAAPPPDARPAVGTPPAASAVEAVAPAGLAARPTAFGGARHLVFLHGRGQQDKDPAKLRVEWAAGLNRGLTRAGLTTIDPADACFPFYGAALMDAIRQHEAAPGSFDEAAAPGGPAAAAEACAPAGPARGTYERLIAGAAGAAGMPSEDQPATEGLGGFLGGALQRQLSWLAAKTDLDEWVIAATLRDVAAYLDHPGVRETVLDSVTETMPTTGELVLVSHSLGTVVAMDLVTRLAPGIDLTLLVTAGSPLGLDAVYDRLLAGGPRRPDRVAHWVNAWCPTDTVAVGCPLRNTWKGELTDLAVANPRDRAHAIDEYLGHPEVAAAIGRTLDRA
ncbi:trypsin-like serine peptidase [Streptomyces sp. NPDC004267]|uniref:trypsin-like serine peptidase n=1 Tax=Streptomyces sp. NPDC004267 TaxID=3364694 RepID=UPI0036AFA9E9